jgi:hypothetical protein
MIVAEKAGWEMWKDEKQKYCGRHLGVMLATIVSTAWKS